MDVIMPQLGETVREGIVAAWHKKVGDSVEIDEPLFEVETDKVTMEIPSPAAGIVGPILVEAGVTVKVGAKLTSIVTAGAEAKPPAMAASNPATVAAAAPAACAAEPAGGGGKPLPRSGPGGPKLSPVVRRLLGERALSPAQVTGSGRDGRITREDVLAYLGKLAEPVPAAAVAASAAPAAQAPIVVAAQAVPAAVMADGPVSAGPDDIVIPLSKIRRLTAAHMVRSKAISPHTLQAVEVDFHKVDRARKLFGAQWKDKHGHSLTYLPFIAHAVCKAIEKFAYVNSSFGNDELIVHKRVHLGIAVDLDFEGLMVTTIRDAQHRNLPGLAAEIHRLAVAARQGKLRPDETAGGTYTISNSGSFGTYFSAPIINQPQAAILSTDGVRKKPVVIEGPDGDTIGIRPIGVLAQSFDHRAFDGGYSAAFLRCLKEILESRDWCAELQ